MKLKFWLLATNSGTQGIDKRWWIDLTKYVWKILLDGGLECGFQNLLGDLTLIIFSLKSCVRCLLSSSLVFLFLNVLYFGCILVAAVSVQFLPSSSYMAEPVEANEFFLGLDWPLMILAIFLSNLVLSSFVFVTLPGLVFFPLSAVTLAVRAVLWGFLLSRLPTPQFLAAFPTLILEGEGYVLASAAGVDLGLSWLKPGWMYKEEELPRSESFRRALKDCLRFYVLVATFLLAAAAVEVATISFLGTPS